jgi:nitroreductase
MNVIEALAKRRSVRAFLPAPVEREKLIAIFEAAARTPSWANSQPWEVFVATGEALARIKKGYGESYANKVATAPETPAPTAWTEVAVKRREQLVPDMRRDCGEAVQQFGQLNQTLFGAPAVIYPCMDKVLSPWSLYDIGAYSQSLMLAAAEYGLGTIPAMTLTLFPDILHRELAIPDNLKVTIGIAIGYADTQNAINNFVSARTPVDQNVRIRD